MGAKPSTAPAGGGDRKRSEAKDRAHDRDEHEAGSDDEEHARGDGGEHADSDEGEARSKRKKKKPAKIALKPFPPEIPRGQWFACALWLRQGVDARCAEPPQEVKTIDHKVEIAAAQTASARPTRSAVKAPPKKPKGPAPSALWITMDLA